MFDSSGALTKNYLSCFYSSWCSMSYDWDCDFAVDCLYDNFDEDFWLSTDLRWAFRRDVRILFTFGLFDSLFFVFIKLRFSSKSTILSTKLSLLSSSSLLWAGLIEAILRNFFKSSGWVWLCSYPLAVTKLVPEERRFFITLEITRVWIPWLFRFAVNTLFSCFNYDVFDCIDELRLIWFIPPLP